MRLTRISIPRPAVQQIALKAIAEQTLLHTPEFTGSTSVQAQLAIEPAIKLHFLVDVDIAYTVS